MIKISAIICTFKRPDYLRQALRTLCNQTLSRDDYEIIVVDNAVEAEAEQVVREFEDGKVNLRYVTETQVGLSLARNTGLRVALGRHVAYIDDDARADEHWLEAIVGAFDSSPNVAAVGGRVWLDWQGEKPAWVSERYLSLYSFVDHGPAAHVLENGEYLVGANLAFEKEALVSLGGFDKKLGRQGQVLLSGEEAAILAQLRERHLGVYYEPEALVWHSVDESRRRPSWLLRRLFWDGASQPLVDRPGSRKLERNSAFTAALKDFRQCLRWGLTMFVAAVRFKRDKLWESLLGFSQRAGRLRTHLLLSARKLT